MMILPTDRDPDFSDPFAVSDHVLEVTRQAIVNRDADAFIQRFVVPQTIGSFEGDTRLETLDDVANMFYRLNYVHDQQGTVDLLRRTIAAHFVGDDIVEATFKSQFLSRDNQLSDEIIAHGRLQRVDGIWKIAESRYATDNVMLSQALAGGHRKTSSD